MNYSKLLSYKLLKIKNHKKDYVIIAYNFYSNEREFIYVRMNKKELVNKIQELKNNHYLIEDIMKSCCKRKRFK